MSEEKMNEQEAEKKAKQLQEMHHRLAESHASAFEAWLNENKDATKEQAHERLTQTIEMAIMFSMMSLATL